MKKWFKHCSGIFKGEIIERYDMHSRIETKFFTVKLDEIEEPQMIAEFNIFETIQEAIQAAEREINHWETIRSILRKERALYES